MCFTLLWSYTVRIFVPTWPVDLTLGMFQMHMGRLSSDTVAVGVDEGGFSDSNSGEGRLA